MANLFSLLSLTGCILLILLGINRGFDISDEGFYVLLTVPTQENEAGIINYDLFFKLLFRLTGYSFTLTDLRLMRLVSYFLAAWALTRFLQYRFTSTYSKWQLFLLSILGLLSGYAFHAQTLSYNSLTVVLSCFWLYTAYSNRSIYRKSCILGIIFALLVYVKVTVAIILFLVSIGLWIKKNQFSLISLGLFLLPFVVLEIIFWIFLGKCASVRLSDAIPINTLRPDYGIIPMLKSPFIGLLFTIFGLLIGSLLSLVKAKSYLSLVFAWAICLGFFLWLVSFTHITEEWNHVVMLATSVFLGFLWVNSKSKWSCSLEEITMFFLPFLLHLGSNFYWLRIGIHYWFFWMLLIVIYIGRYSNKIQHIVAFLSILLVFNGVWWHPYGQDKPLWSAKVDLDRGGEIIKVEKELVNSVIKIQEFAKDRGVSQIQTAYGVPGMIWLAGYQIPHSAGVWNKIQLESISMFPPNELVFCQHDVLPEGWNYTHSITLGNIQGHPPIYLLWN